MTPETTAEVANLRATVSDLTLQLSNLTMGEREPRQDLAQGEDRYELGFDLIYRDLSVFTSTKDVSMTITPTWNEIFRGIGPSIINEANTAEIAKALSQVIDIYVDEVSALLPKDYGKFVRYDPYDGDVDDIIVQFFALNLLERGTQKRAVTDKQKYWRLTGSGQNLMMELRAIGKDGSVLRQPARIAGQPQESAT